MKLKILNYNLLNGFCNDHSPYVTDHTRMRVAARVIAREKPDIIVLTEAYLWPFVLKAHSKDIHPIFKKMYSFISEPKGQFRWAPVVLSRFPIEYEDHCVYQKQWIRAHIKVPRCKLVLDVVHPHPDLSEDARAEFISTMLMNVPKNYVLSGDFNALSPEDSYDRDRLIKGYQTFTGAMAERKVDDLLKQLTVKKILVAGLQDTFIKANVPHVATVPTDLRSKDKRSAVRIDYIFCSNGFKIVDAGIIKNKNAERGSDHYPIYAVLEL